MMVTHHTNSQSAKGFGSEPRLLLFVLCASQVVISANLATLATAIGVVTQELATVASSVQLAFIAYGLATAAIVIPAGKLGSSFGTLWGFRLGILTVGLGILVAAGANGIRMLIVGEAVAGLGAAFVEPALVGLIAAHYTGARQASVIGMLSASAGIGGAAGLLLGGWSIGLLGWRIALTGIAACCGMLCLLSGGIRSQLRSPHIPFDMPGLILSTLGMLFVVGGISQIASWGLIQANDAAPFHIRGLSPVPLLILIGILLLQGFFVWQQRIAARGNTPLLSPLISDTPTERSAMLLLVVINTVISGIAFLIPLYTQLVQGFSALQTAWALVPFGTATFLSAIFANRLSKRRTPRAICRLAFLAMALGLACLAVSITDHWQTIGVVVGLVLSGFGVGVLASILNTVMISASSADLGGDIGAIRSVANNLGGALGAALVCSLVSVSLIAAAGTRLQSDVHVTDSTRVLLDVNHHQFVSNDVLRTYLERIPEIPSAEVDRLLELNTSARLDALRVAILFLASVAILALFVCRHLPDTKGTDRVE